MSTGVPISRFSPDFVSDLTGLRFVQPSRLAPPKISTSNSYDLTVKAPRSYVEDRSRAELHSMSQFFRHSAREITVAVAFHDTADDLHTYVRAQKSKFFQEYPLGSASEGSSFSCSARTVSGVGDGVGGQWMCTGA